MKTDTAICLMILAVTIGFSGGMFFNKWAEKEFGEYNYEYFRGNLTHRDGRLFIIEVDSLIGVNDREQFIKYEYWTGHRDGRDSSFIVERLFVEMDAETYHRCWYPIEWEEYFKDRIKSKTYIYVMNDGDTVQILNDGERIRY